MNTRYIKSLLSVFAAVIIMTGCDALLDVEPQQSISDNIALDTPENVQSVLNGAYARLGAADLYAGRVQMMSDLLVVDGNEIFWSGTFQQPQEAYFKDLLTDNSYIRTIWRDAYITINRANTALSGLDVIENDATRTRIEGEAKFIRGLAHFALVTHYSKAWNDGNPGQNLGVPIMSAPAGNVIFEEGKGRDSVADVYAFVIQDLEDARDMIPASNGFYATSYAASAILSRVYLAQGEWAAAATEANRVIESGAFSLTDTFAEAFNNQNNSSEDVFAIQNTTQAGTNSLHTFYASSANAGRGDVDIQQAHLDLYEAGDDRLNLFYEDEDGSGDIRSGKFQRTLDANVSIVRLAEMYLTRAEANFRLVAAGQAIVGTATPADDLTTVRARVNLPAVAAVTSVDEILAERRVELAFEGDRFSTLKREEGEVRGLSAGELIPWNANNLVFPIPQRELDANPGIRDQQNPGYN